MNEKKLSRICLAITFIGFLMIIPFSNSFLEEKNISTIISSEQTKGCVFGRVDFIIKNGPPTIFFLTDGNTTKVFSPKKLDIKKNDFVTICGESQIYNGEMEIFAYHTVIE
jgi:hypothetical protein